MNQFTITYENGTQFIGDPLQSDWTRIDETLKIAKFEYLFNGICITMQGYSQYNHLLECVALGQKGIQKIFLMGRGGEQTEIIVIDLKRGKIYKDFKPLYREYGEQILNGWQNGVLNNPTSSMRRVNV